MIKNLILLKRATGIKEANCSTCAYLGWEGDGPEYNGNWAVCDNPQKKHVSNLKTFPFKSDQKCWKPEFWHSKFADEVKTGEDEEERQ